MSRRAGCRPGNLLGGGDLKDAQKGLAGGRPRAAVVPAGVLGPQTEKADAAAGLVDHSGRILQRRNFLSVADRGKQAERKASRNSRAHVHQWANWAEAPIGHHVMS